MSLAVLADHMASKGRGPDSMLIHMSPREVQGLQALAVQQGGSLTINPETGLPEAGFLDKLLPAIIGFAVTAATGLPAWQVGLGVGAVETARTGDLGRGISAGLGAYGGGNLGTSFTGAGEGLIGEQAIASEAGRQAVAQNIMEGQMTEEAARSAVMKDAVANAGTFEKLGSGFEAATGKGGMQALKAASPMGAPGLGYSAAMAAGPAIMAEMSAKKNMPQTVTRPGMITPYSFDPYSGTYHAATPYRAAEGGLMGMNSGGYNPGQLDFTQKSEPVVRMAIGGDTKKALEDAYAAQDYKTVQDLVNKNQVTAGDVGGTWQGFDTSGLAGLGVNLYTKNDMFSPTNTRAEQESAVNQYYQNQGVTPDQLGQTNFGYPVDTRESRLANAPYTNLYEDYQKDLANTGRYDAPTDTQFRTQAVYEPAGLGNRGAIKLYDTATGQHLTNVDMGNQVQAFELLDKFGVDPASYRQALGASFGTAGVPEWQKDDYDYLMGYKPRNVASATTAYLAKPLQNLTVADLTPRYETSANDRQTADSKVNTDWLGSTQRLLMSKGLGVEEASNLLHQFNGVAGLVNWAEINRSEDPVTAIIGTLNTLQSKGLTNQTGDKLRNVGKAMVDASGQLIGHKYQGADAATKLRNLGFKSGLAEGGLASLAGGGDVQRFAIGDLVKADIDKAYAAGDYAKVNELAQANKITAADVADTYKGFDTSGLAGLGINLFTPPAAPTYNQYTNEQIGKYLTDNPTADIAAATKTTNADPAAVNAYIASLTSPFKGSTADERGSGTLGIYNQMVAQGVDPSEYYAAATAADPKYAGWTKDMIQEGYNLDKAMYALSDTKKGVVTDTDWAKLMVGNGTWDKPQYDPNEMAQATGLSIKEVQARYELEKAKANPVITCGVGFKLSADGKSCVPDIKGLVTCGAGYKLSADGKSCVPDTKVVTPETQCPTGYHYDPVLKQCVLNTSATQNTSTNVTTPTSITTAPATTLPVGVSGSTGASIIGGGTTVNPNGTITTSPRIPGIPVGGFTGMENLRNVYEEGGGSLGYVPYAPKTMDEFDKKYTSKLTGGSKQAYDYLTGKTPYSPTPSTPTGEIMKPYAESVLGIPTVSSKKMYLFDPATKQYKINPDYAIPTRDSKGKVTTSLTNKDVAEFVGTAPSYDALYTWMTTNNLSPEQVATASGKPFTEINKQFLKAQGLAGDDGKIDQTKLDEKTAADEKANFDADAYLKANPDVQAELDAGKANFGTKDDPAAAAYEHYLRYGKAGGRKYTKKAAGGGLMNMAMARGGMSQQFDLGGYSDGGRLLRGPGDGVSDSIPATIGNKRPARLADGEFVVPARIVSELGNGSTEAGARKLYAMMDRVQSARRHSIGKGKVAKNSRADKYLPA